MYTPDHEEIGVNELIVGVRELKAHMGSYLRVVREGGTLLITDRGAPVGRIVPVSRSRKTPEQLAAALVEAGMASWGGGKLEPLDPPAKLRGGKTVSDLLVEDRG
jgi:prevent-host-death family protein